MNVQKLQEYHQESHYQYIKNAILDNIRKHIRDNPYDYHINYYKGSSFLVRTEKGLGDPIWIYNNIETYYDKLEKDLKIEGITLYKVKNYEVKTKGFFRKKEYKEFQYEQFILTWKND